MQTPSPYLVRFIFHAARAGGLGGQCTRKITLSQQVATQQGAVAVESMAVEVVQPYNFLVAASTCQQPLLQSRGASCSGVVHLEQRCPKESAETAHMQRLLLQLRFT